MFSEETEGSLSSLLGIVWLCAYLPFRKGIFLLWEVVLRARGMYDGMVFSCASKSYRCDGSFLRSVDQTPPTPKE